MFCNAVANWSYALISEKSILFTIFANSSCWSTGNSFIKSARAEIPFSPPYLKASINAFERLSLAVKDKSSTDSLFFISS